MDVKTLSVIQLSEYIKSVFDDELLLHDITVYGEIYQINRSGTTVFVTLREGDCLIHCMYFGTLEKTYEVGTKVKLYGSVNYFMKGGKLNFIFKSMQPFGSGELYSNFLKLKNRLQEEGLFDHKKPLPNCIRRIAIITSEAGAVIHDFLFTVHRYYSFGKVDIFPVAVQGAGAPEAITAAIALVNGCGRQYDVLVLARGGGSSDDLETFNTEKVARAVAESIIPVMSAVGHENDYTLCDFCASVRAGTPSIAGEMIADKNAQIIDRLQNTVKRLTQNFNAFFAARQSRLFLVTSKMTQRATLKTSLAYQRLHYGTAALKSRFKALFETKKLQVVELVQEGQNCCNVLLNHKETDLEASSKGLDKNSPLRILSQGYAKVYKQGKSVVSVASMKSGDEMHVFFKDGKSAVKVMTTEKYLQQNVNKKE